jgi:hypothetical protein
MRDTAEVAGGIPWRCARARATLMVTRRGVLKGYRGTSLIRNRHPPRITEVPGHWATVGSYGGEVLMSEAPL